MSGRISKLAAGLVTLLIAGAAVACPGAADLKSSSAQGAGASTSSTGSLGSIPEAIDSPQRVAHESRSRSHTGTAR